MSDLAELERIARRIRSRVVEISHRAQTPHLGSSLSVVDILVAAYWTALKIDPKRPADPDRDRMIFSKGHAISALYCTLAERGFFPLEKLSRYNEPGSGLPEQPSPGCSPGVELATGSLGHGLPFGVGQALAARLAGRSHRVVVVMSDGECEEGSVWEAAMMAPTQKLGGLCAVIDFNKWQATGRSCEVMSLDPLAKKFEAFGWNALEVDGHDLKALTAALAVGPDGSGKPRAIVAHTVKGRGVSFMQDDNNWHYRSPSADELARAQKELA